MLEYTIPILYYKNNKYTILTRKDETTQFSLLPYKLNRDHYKNIEDTLDIKCCIFSKQKLFPKLTFQNNLIQINYSSINLCTNQCLKNNLIIIVPLHNILNYTTDIITIYSAAIINKSLDMNKQIGNINNKQICNINNKQISNTNYKSMINNNNYIDIFICSVFCNILFFLYIIILELHYFYF